MNILKKTAHLLSDYDFDLWDIFFEETESRIISLEDSKIEQFASGKISGVGIRVVKDFNVFYSCFDEIKEKNFLDIIKNIKSNFLIDRKNKKNIHIQRIITNKNNIKIPHNKIKTDKKIELLKDMDNYIRKISQNIKQVKLTLSEKIQDVKIINDTGNYVWDKRIYTTFIIFIVAGKENIIETGYSVISGCAGYELFEQQDIKEKVNETAESALRLLDIKEKITGKMPAVISAKAGGTLIHEAVGHSLEADLVQKDMSEYYKDKTGEKVASSLITVIDDATLSGKRGSYNFDDEGIMSQKTILIENGILKNYLYDRITALKDKKNPTGNGRRESFLHIPIPRMSNIYIKPGKGKEKDLIKDTKTGIYIKKMGGGQVNTVTGEFIFEIKEGYKIENGKITKPVRDATLLGKGPEILKSIDAVCDDLGFESGTCGKDGQGVPVSDAQPTIRIPEILIGSK